MYLNLASLIDHTLLRVDASEEEIRKLCSEALQHSFAAVCVQPFFVSLAQSMVLGSKVKVCTVLDFPMGCGGLASKVPACQSLVEMGVHEIDVVAHAASLLSGEEDRYYEEILSCADVCRKSGVVLKVIIETALLNQTQIRRATVLSASAGAHFVKTSTGYASRGASVEDILVMKQALMDHGFWPKVAIKASGGIKSKAFAMSLYEAGATRIGSSASVTICS